MSNCITNFGQIIKEVVSNVSSIANLDEPIRGLVIGSYVKSLEGSHSKLSDRVQERD